MTTLDSLRKVGSCAISGKVTARTRTAAKRRIRNGLTGSLIREREVVGFLPAEFAFVFGELVHLEVQLPGLHGDEAVVIGRSSSLVEVRGKAVWHVGGCAASTADDVHDVVTLVA